MNNKSKQLKLKNQLDKISIFIFITLLVISLIFLPACHKTETQDNNDNSNNITNDFQITDDLPKAENENKPVKVILLGGQSNASGVSSVAYLSQKINITRYNTLSTGYPDVLINFFNENGYNSSNGSFVPTGFNQGCTEGYFGPELGLAESLSVAYPDETIFIIKYAWGGTNLYNQWLSPSSEGDTGPLYTAFINFVHTSMSYLISQNYNAKIVAMCWMQGESDSDDVNSQTYGTHTTNFVSDLRSEFSQYISENGMLFIDAGISDSVYWTNYNTINLAKSAHAKTSPLNVYIDTIKEGLSYKTEPEETPDLAHYDSLAGLQLGNLFAEAIISKLNTIN
ncbi:MAG: sialate O-acetylesterase [Clostridiales bacterium]|jgi:hypothetical protein|nr:sialate O-acetylesterase [Clostridiales bacterium]